MNGTYSLPYEEEMLKSPWCSTTRMMASTANATTDAPDREAKSFSRTTGASRAHRPSPTQCESAAHSSDRIMAVLGKGVKRPRASHL